MSEELGPFNVPSPDADALHVSEDDGKTTEENPIDDKPEPSDMSEHKKFDMSMTIGEKTMSIPHLFQEILWGSDGDMFDPLSGRLGELVLMTHWKSGVTPFHSEGTQWTPSQEQTRILEMLYSGGLRQPTMRQINRITSMLIQYGKIEDRDVYLWFRAHRAQERQEQTSSSLSPTGMEGLKIKEIPTSPNTSELDQEQEGIDKIGKSPASPRVSEGDKDRAVSFDEKSGIGEVVSMSSEMSGPKSQEQEGSSRYDNTGKLLPINLEKQRELISTVEENIDVRANIIFLDRDYSQESDSHISSQQEISLPTVYPSANSNQGEASRHEGQDNTKISDPKKRRWFNLFPWWQKK